MNADYLAALGAGPPFLFVSNEMPYPKFRNVLQIVNHAHAVLGSIPVIQMVQPGARKAATTEAVLNLGIHYLLAVLNRARDAGFRFETIVTSAAGAGLYISHICPTKATVHSAGGDQRRANQVCFC